MAMLRKSEFIYHFPDMTMAMYIWVQREYEGRFSGWFKEMYDILRDDTFLDRVYEYVNRYYKIEKHTVYERFSHEDAKAVHDSIEKRPHTNAMIVRLCDGSFIVVSFVELAKLGKFD